MRRTVGKPFLRWAGGKSRIVRHLLDHLPPAEFGDYWEPFLGAGALFFALAPRTAYLSDSNSDLMACYEQVRDKSDLVYKYLRHYVSKTCEEYYYRMRDLYNRSKPRRSATQAARFIYLNRTSFNGIYRVNLKGEYNVPYGFKEPPPMPTLDDLRVASDLLRNATLSDKSFDEALSGNAPDTGDFLYLDPPYPPLNTTTATFAHYTKARFSWGDQERVAEIANRLAQRGCYVMVSNLDTEAVRKLYSGWSIIALPVVRFISANGQRDEAGELVITSY